MKKVTPKAEKAYQELLNIVNYIEEKRKLGWLLIDRYGEIETGKFCFSNVFVDKCISLQHSENCYGTIIDYGECHIHGTVSFLQECRAAKKFLLKYKLFEPKEIHPVWK